MAVAAAPAAVEETSAAVAAAVGAEWSVVAATEGSAVADRRFVAVHDLCRPAYHDFHVRSPLLLQPLLPFQSIRHELHVLHP